MPPVNRNPRCPICDGLTWYHKKTDTYTCKVCYKTLHLVDGILVRQEPDRSQNPICVQCGIKTVKKGFYKGQQRYICTKCGATGTPERFFFMFHRKGPDGIEIPEKVDRSGIRPSRGCSKRCSDWETCQGLQREHRTVKCEAKVTLEVGKERTVIVV